MALGLITAKVYAVGNQSPRQLNDEWFIKVYNLCQSYFGFPTALSVLNQLWRRCDGQFHDEEERGNIGTEDK